MIFKHKVANLNPGKIFDWFFLLVDINISN
jgi:hypothetical protein